MIEPDEQPERTRSRGIQDAIVEQLHGLGFDVHQAPEITQVSAPSPEYGEWFDVTELPDGTVVSAREVRVPDVPWWGAHVEITPVDQTDSDAG